MFQELAVQLYGACRSVSMKLEIKRIVKDGIDYAIQDAPKQSSFLEGDVLPFALILPTDNI